MILRYSTFAPLPSQEAMDDVSAEVDAQPDGYDEAVHGGDVYGEVPPVHEPRHVRERQQHAHHDKQITIKPL